MVFSTISCKGDNSQFILVTLKCFKIHKHPISLYLGNRVSENRLSYLQRCTKSLTAIIFMWWDGLQENGLHETAIREV